MSTTNKPIYFIAYEYTDISNKDQVYKASYITDDGLLIMSNGDLEAVKNTIQRNTHRIVTTITNISRLN